MKRWMTDPFYIKYTGMAVMFAGMAAMAAAHLEGEVRSTLGYTGLAIALPSTIIAGIAWILDAANRRTCGRGAGVRCSTDSDATQNIP